MACVNYKVLDMLIFQITRLLEMVLYLINAKPARWFLKKIVLSNGISNICVNLRGLCQHVCASTCLLQVFQAVQFVKLLVTFYHIITPCTQT